MAFNPTDFGFQPIKTSHGGIKRDYCYIRMSQRLYVKGRAPKVISVLCLDDVTTDFCMELFGKHVGVAIDDKCRIVLYKGNTRTISKSNSKSNKGTISLEMETESIRSMLGEFKVYRFEPKVYAKGEAILLTPDQAVSV